MASSYTIGEHFEKMIKEQVATGRYASASEVVREALRLFEDSLQEKISTGENFKVFLSGENLSENDY